MNKQELEKLYPKLAQAVEEASKKYNADFIDFQRIFSGNKEYSAYFSHTDPVHLIDKGQEIVAGKIFEKLKTSPDKE